VHVQMLAWRSTFSVRQVEGERRVCGVKQLIGATVDTRKKVSVIAMIQHATSGIQSDEMA
jgi:hypothetical protein